MKTVQDYMNDPRITGDPEMMAAPEPIREIHAVRLKYHDETAGMTVDERLSYIRKKSDAFFANAGMTPDYVSFPGQGLLRRPETVLP
jgi:hypothetical protein